MEQDGIPQENGAAVARALQEAFGVTECEDIRRLIQGRTTSLVYRIVVRGTPYLLKIITRSPDPTFPDHVACIRGAADAGLAPRVWYTSLVDRILISDFVGAVPLPLADALVRMPAFLRSLHALPPFPSRVSHLNTTCTFLFNKGPAVDGFLQGFRTAGIVPAEEVEEVFVRFSQMAAVYECPDADRVSSHNDLFKPDNILFDGQRVWLVDWEAAFLNDRYAELAAVANMLVTNDEEEQTFLREYFGQAPDDYQLSRLFLMRQVAHLFYGTWFQLTGGPTVPGEEASNFTAFHRRFWEGEVDLAEKPMKALYGRFHWNELVRNVRQARFDEALRIVSDRQAKL